MTSSFDRILLPLGPDSDRSRLLLPASVFSSWFGAPLQLVCSQPDAVAEYDVLARSLGVAIEPILCLGDAFGPEMAAHADAHAPCIIITEPSAAGLALAGESTQPVFLVADGLGHRMPVGPLPVEITGRAEDLDALALAAVLSGAIDESVRLVVGSELSDGPDRATEAEARLRQVGCDVGTDSVQSHDEPALVLTGRTRGATAIVVPAERLRERGLIDSAIAGGVNVFVAPAPRSGSGRAAPFAIDLDRPADRAPAGAQMQVLDREECAARLGRHSMARIGYVDGGWPVIVPVNYRLHNGDVFIRSLGGGKLRAAERGDTVCLELDGHSEALRTGWSVVAHGTLEVIHDPAVLQEAWANDPQPWVASDHWQWLRMVPVSMTGREVSPTAAVVDLSGC